MFKPIPAAIGLRYLRAKRRNGFISFISLASILGIALGVTVLITTMAVMSGFQKEIRDRLLQFAAHATVVADGEPMADWKFAVDLAMQDARVSGAAPFVETEALLSGSRKQPAMVRGVMPELEQRVSVLAQKMKQGSADSLVDGSYHILLGQELALFLGVSTGDPVMVMLPEFQGSPMGAMPRYKRFTVSGIFSAGHNDIDRGLAVVHMADLQRVLRMDGASGVRLMLHDMNQAYEVARDLALQLPGFYRVTDWTRDNANLYQSLKMEKTVMGILLSFIILMGAFSLVNSQVMLVTDKQADIAILRTLGLTPGGVMQVFMVQGTVIGCIGTLIGGVLGVIVALHVSTWVAWLERDSGAHVFSSDVYFISSLPSDLRGLDVLMICGAALSMSFLATLYPSWRASRTQPAEALRYE